MKKIILLLVGAISLTSCTIEEDPFAIEKLAQGLVDEKIKETKEEKTNDFFSQFDDVQSYETKRSLSGKGSTTIFTITIEGEQDQMLVLDDQGNEIPMVTPNGFDVHVSLEKNEVGEVVGAFLYYIDGGNSLVGWFEYPTHRGDDVFLLEGDYQIIK